MVVRVQWTARAAPRNHPANRDAGFASAPTLHASSTVLLRVKANTVPFRYSSMTARSENALPDVGEQMFGEAVCNAVVRDRHVKFSVAVMGPGRVGRTGTSDAACVMPASERRPHRLISLVTADPALPTPDIDPVVAVAHSPLFWSA